MLTDEQKQHYIARRGTRCPFCQCEDIEGSSVEIDAGSASQDITCLNDKCGKSWTDIYQLIDVEELKTEEEE